MRRPVAIAVLSALLAVTAVAGPAHACGCGVIMPPKQETVQASNERALVYWDGERETIELMLDMNSTALEFGMIIPTPLPAVVSEGDARIFDTVEDSIEPRERVETDWWGLGYLLPDPPLDSVTIVERLRVGWVESTTIEAADTVALTAWLATNGFEVPAAAQKALDIYVQRGWSFTVLRLANDDGITGQLDPIRISFDTNRLVYPARLVAAETEPKELRLYVFDKQRVNVAKAHQPTVDIDASVSIPWAGEVGDNRLREMGAYLTVFDIHWGNPKEHAASDLAFVYSTSEQDVIPEQVHYRMITLLGVPVGTLVVGWLLIGFALITGHFVGRRRAR
jgi:hypothetical protein